MIICKAYINKMTICKSYTNKMIICKSYINKMIICKSYTNKIIICKTYINKMTNKMQTKLCRIIEENKLLFCQGHIKYIIKSWKINY